MKKLLYLALTVLSFACSKKSETTSQEAEVTISETIQAEDFAQKINSFDNEVIIDVRTPEELAGGYIEGAINIDYKADDFKTKLSSLDKDKTYFVYCAAGRRSRGAADLMKELNFKEVYDLSGGFTNWSAQGFPVKKDTQ